MPGDERLVVTATALLACTPAWLRGGTHAPWSLVLLWMAVALLALLVALTVRRARAGLPVFLRLRDPVVWLSLILAVEVAIQWWNSGRILYFDSALRAWTYSPPRIAWLPSAITTHESRQMLDWFIPAWVILTAIRAPGVSSRGIRVLWRIVVANASILALFGLVQFASGTTHMFWFIPMRPHFFASFGYPNHAGSYFLLAMGLAASLLGFELLRGDLRRYWLRATALTTAFVLALLAANLALSRASIIASWLIAVPSGIYLLRLLLPRLAPVHRVNAVAAGAAILCLAAMLTLGIGHDAIRTEFKPEDDNKTFMERETSFRWFQLKAAAQIWSDHPMYGVGGWGYRYLLGHYIPQTEWRRITEGKANVHNDPIQFLCEFGLLGVAPVTVAIGILVVHLVRRRRVLPPHVVLPLVPVGVVALQSMIDLPFRSPAVLCLWLVCLAGAARLAPSPRPAIPRQPS